ncbi:MAG: hypothetical protein ABIT83_20185 [Massilia sp.]
MSTFTITVRTLNSTTTYPAQSRSSYEAFVAAIETHGDMPCGITVTLLSA